MTRKHENIIRLPKHFPFNIMGVVTCYDDEMFITFIHIVSSGKVYIVYNRLVKRKRYRK